jgi:hypothetical protein
MEIKGKIGIWLNNQLKIQLSENKTLITSFQKRVKFLGFIIGPKSSIVKNKRTYGKGIISI